MRLAEIVCEDQGAGARTDEANIVTALDLIRNRIIEAGLSFDIPTNIILKFIQNTGIPGFGLHDLIAANENSSAIKNIVKNITPDTVTFNSDTSGSVANQQDYEGAVSNPEQTVSNMAKAAMKRRQK